MLVYFIKDFHLVYRSTLRNQLGKQIPVIQREFSVYFSHYQNFMRNKKNMGRKTENQMSGSYIILG